MTQKRFFLWSIFSKSQNWFQLEANLFQRMHPTLKALSKINKRHLRRKLHYSIRKEWIDLSKLLVTWMRVKAGIPTITIKDISSKNPIYQTVMWYGFLHKQTSLSTCRRAVASKKVTSPSNICLFLSNLWGVFKQVMKQNVTNVIFLQIGLHASAYQREQDDFETPFTAVHIYREKGYVLLFFYSFTKFFLFLVNLSIYRKLTSSKYSSTAAFDELRYILATTHFTR